MLATVQERAADLHWLAYLLTGSRETSVDVASQFLSTHQDANQFFDSWMSAWARRIVIAKALAAVRDEMEESAARTRSRRTSGARMPPGGWALDGATSKVDLERALLAIDMFPRATLILAVFERVPIADVAVLLDSDPKWVAKAHAIGLHELTANLARAQGYTPAPARPFLIVPEVEHA